MPFNSSRRSVILYALAVTVLLLQITRSIGRFTQLEESIRLSRAAAAISLHQGDRAFQLAAQEAAVRAYVATSRPEFLSAYYRSRSNAASDEAFALRYTPLLGMLRKPLRQSDDVIAREQAALDREIDLARAGRHAPAIAAMRQEQRLFERSMRASRSVEDAAELQMNASTNAALAEVRRTIIGTLVFAGILIFASVAVFAVYRRERIARLSALNDPLTGVGNRRKASVLLSRLIGAYAQQQVGVIYLDLDNFKKVNDSYGHSSGDSILREAALRLRGELRAQDEVCRMGGDEFVCVIAPPVDPQTLSSLCKRLYDVVAKPYRVEGEDFIIGCSVGWSLSPDDGTDAEQLLSRADRAMYQAKTSGGGVSTPARP